MSSSGPLRRSFHAGTRWNTIDRSKPKNGASGLNGTTGQKSQPLGLHAGGARPTTRGGGRRRARSSACRATGHADAGVATQPAEPQRVLDVVLAVVEAGDHLHRRRVRAARPPRTGRGIRRRRRSSRERAAACGPCRSGSSDRPIAPVRRPSSSTRAHPRDLVGGGRVAPTRRHPSRTCGARGARGSRRRARWSAARRGRVRTRATPPTSTGSPRGTPRAGGPRGSRGGRRSRRAAAPASGAIELPQLPNTIDVLPYGGQRVERGVPPHRAVEVRVRVDDPGRHERAPGVDHELTVGREVGPDLDDDAVARPGRRRRRRRARAVDDRARR